MRRLLGVIGLALLAVSATTIGCQQVELTGRRQMVLVSADKEMAMGASAYDEVIAREKASANASHAEMVYRVGRRIAAVTGRDDFQWEFRLFDSPTQNAFCLPGGKVAVYEGILPVCENEAGLAVVMGHEVAHAIARHGAERMSQGMAVERLGGVIQQVAKKQETVSDELIMKAYGAGAQYGVMLPFSRSHELEADRMGLVYMAKAGYDPDEAPRFWERFSKLNSGKSGSGVALLGGIAAKISEYASTHPPDARRAADLRDQLPAARALYAAAPQRYALGDPIVVTTPRR